MKLGLTGTIGSGKSTVARLLGEQGFTMIDTDRLARLQLEQNEVQRELQIRYGETVFHTDGTVDRGKLAHIVFGDRGELSWLEELLHPRIRQEWIRQTEAEPDTDWIVEVPLLFEKKLESYFDFTICVECQNSIRWNRLREKSLSDADIERRENSQFPPTEKERRADFVISNSGTLSLLKTQINQLQHHLKVHQLNNKK